MQNTPVYEVLLVGDSGNIKRNQPDELLETLKSNLPIDYPSAVIFLGDNIYPYGLPEKNDALRKDAELVLNKHHEALKNYKGKVIFLSGNHDWNKGKDDGLSYVLRQEKYLEQLFDGKNVMLPSKGCPGPKEIPINKQLIIIAINTQWWLQPNPKPMGIKDGCNIQTEQDFFLKIEKALADHLDKTVLILGHYPIYSYSLHGGKYDLKHHLFPLTLYKKNAYVPLPFVGSLLPFYRKYVGAKEDISHYKFRRLRDTLKDMFKKYPNVIYACGHEHNLQHIQKHGVNYIVSGSASKATYVTEGKHAKFGLSAKGFFKIKFYENGLVKAEAIVTDIHQAKGNLAYETIISNISG